MLFKCCQWYFHKERFINSSKRGSLEYNTKIINVKHEQLVKMTYKDNQCKT